MQKLARSLKRISSRKSEQDVTVGPTKQSCAENEVLEGIAKLTAVLLQPKASSGLGNPRTSAVLADAGSQPQSPTAVWQRGSFDTDKQPNQSGRVSNGVSTVTSVLGRTEGYWQVVLSFCVLPNLQFHGEGLQNIQYEDTSDATRPQTHSTFLAAFDRAQVLLPEMCSAWQPLGNIWFCQDLPIHQRQIQKAFVSRLIFATRCLGEAPPAWLTHGILKWHHGIACPATWVILIAVKRGH